MLHTHTDRRALTALPVVAVNQKQICWSEKGQTCLLLGPIMLFRLWIGNVGLSLIVICVSAASCSMEILAESRIVFNSLNLKPAARELSLVLPQMVATNKDRAL